TGKTQKVIRGGSFNEYGPGARIALRRSRVPTAKSNHIGFRFVRGVLAVPPTAVAPFEAKKAQEYQQLWADHLKRPVEETNSIGMKLRLIPAGEFLMGASVEELKKLLEGRPDAAAVLAERKQHLVRIT